MIDLTHRSSTRYGGALKAALSATFTGGAATTGDIRKRTENKQAGPNGPIDGIMMVALL